MMPVEKALRLQAWVDGESDPREAREIEAWVRHDPEAQTFADDLRRINTVLRSAEPERATPETREFYWSTIARGIERQAELPGRGASEPAGASAVAWWWRWLVPIGALAAIAVSVPLLRTVSHPQHRVALAAENEVDTPIAGVNAFTFRSESERMTVVWVDFNSD